MKYFQIGIFLSVILALLALGNLVVYYGLVRVFALASAGQLVLGIIFVLLTFSFVFASLISHRYDNIFSRSLYLVSASWLGFLFYFVLAVLLSDLAKLVPGVNIRLITAELFVLAALIGTYGLIHARSLRLTAITVELPNLPAVWRNKRAVWISDFHFGPIYQRRHLDRLVEVANSLTPAVVLLGGDIFDGSMVDADSAADSLHGLRAEHGVFFVTGNHDGFSMEAEERFVRAVAATGIRILQNEAVDVQGLQLVGVNNRDTSKRADYAKVLSNIRLDPLQPSVLLKHIPTDVDLSAEKGISFQISGHTHRAQLQPLGFLPRLIFRGFDYGLHKLGKMQIFTSSGAGTWGPPMRVGTDSEIVLIRFV